MNRFVLADALPSKVILTDDPMRVKMLVAHLLEQARPLYEQRGMAGYAGQFQNGPLAVLSCGFGQVAAELALQEAADLGAQEFIYLGEGVAQVPELALMDVVLVSGGNAALLHRAKLAAQALSVPVRVEPAHTNDRYWLEPEYTTLALVDFVSAGVYRLAGTLGLSALCILTVSENAATGGRIDEAARQSRFHAAARLAFELAGSNSSPCLGS